MTPWRASWQHVPDARHHPGSPAPDCSWTEGEDWSSSATLSKVALEQQYCYWEYKNRNSLFLPWWSRQIPQCLWARRGRSRPARTGGGSLSLWSGPRAGWWRCWSGERATAWARRRCSRWSSPCSPSWSCCDGGKRWSAVFWEERRWLGRCCPQVLRGSRYLHMRDKKDRQKMSWLSSCQPAALIWGQTQSLTVPQLLVDDYD